MLGAISSLANGLVSADRSSEIRAIIQSYIGVHGSANRVRIDRAKPFFQHQRHIGDWLIADKR